MAIGVFLTTTGTLNPVVIDDMAGLSFSHPTVDYNLLDDVTADEIQSSADLQLAVSSGWIVLRDDLGDVILDVKAAGPHKHPLGDLEFFGLTPGDVLTATGPTAASFAPPVGGGGYAVEQLTYTDIGNRLIGPLVNTPTPVVNVNLYVPTGGPQEYTKDYTVRQVTGGSAPGYYLCIGTGSTAPGGGSFVGGSNPATGIDSVLSSGDVVRVTYPA